VENAYQLRTVASADELAHLVAVLADAFGHDVSDDDVERDRLVFEPYRNHVVEYEGEPVANAGAFTRELTVPGAVVPAAHVTGVGVRPTHRRRGLLTRLMRYQLREVRDVHREPVAVLWASEGRIYQRFGYGLAAQGQWLTIDNREVRLQRVPDPAAGRLRDGKPEQFRKEMRQVYERVRPAIPGRSSRDENWWSWRLADLPGHRHGYAERRGLLFQGPTGPDGYALWRRKAEWTEAGPRGEVEAVEVVAATPEAYAAVWHFLLSVDLTRTVRYGFAAVDEPLRYLVNEPRALSAWTGDTLWLRLTDVPAALAARRYAAAVDVVFEVTDALLPENAGRWRLTAPAGGPAACAATGNEPDVSCDVADLSAAYLGGTPLGALAAAGRVREYRPDAVAQATAAFGWWRAPAAVDIF
jgi:predicted acetyltransferase